MSWRPDLWMALNRLDYARLHIEMGRREAAARSVIEANEALGRAKRAGQQGGSWWRIARILFRQTQELLESVS